MKQILFIFIIGLLVACVKEPEYAESEIEAVKQAMKNDFLSKTQYFFHNLLALS